MIRLRDWLLFYVLALCVYDIIGNKQKTKNIKDNSPLLKIKIKNLPVFSQDRKFKLPCNSDSA